MRTPQFFRVDGADQETGEETYLVLQAENKPQAERLAREQGILISTVRVAKPDDWGASAAEPAEAAGTAPVVEPEPFVESVVVPATAPADAPPVAPEPPPPAPAARSSAGPVILACAGGALLIGGVLALVLAFWGERAAGNELQVLNFLMRQMIQTVLGAMLVIAGMIVFAIAAVFHACQRS